MRRALNAPPSSRRRAATPTSWRIALAVLLLAAARLAQAEPPHVHRLDRVTLEAPGWAPAPPPQREGDLRAVLALETGAPVDGIQHCQLSRQDLPARAGMTQAIVNADIQGDMERLIAAADSAATFGRRERAGVTMIDGIAVIDMVLSGQKGAQPRYTHLRLFVLVEPDGSGRAHELACWMWTQPSQAHRDSIAAVINSLRIAP